MNNAINISVCLCEYVQAAFNTSGDRHTPHQCVGFAFAHILTNSATWCVFGDSYLRVCEALMKILTCISVMISCTEYFGMCLCLFVFFGEMSISYIMSILSKVMYWDIKFFSSFIFCACNIHGIRLQRVQSIKTEILSTLFLRENTVRFLSVIL